MSLKDTITAKNAAATNGTTQGKKPQETNPLRLNKDLQYEIGELTKDSSLDAPKWRVKPWVRSGKYLLDLGVKDVREYLEKNPEGLRADRTLTIYKIMPGGKKVFLYQQNPSPAAEAAAPAREQGMSDASFDEPQARPLTVPAHMSATGQTFQHEAPQSDEPAAGELTMNTLAAMTREALDVIKQTNRDLVQQLEACHQREAETRNYYDTLIAGYQAEIIKTKQELETAKSQGEAIVKEYELRNDYQKTVNGLQDQVQKSEEGIGLKDIMQILPHIMPLIAPLFQRQDPYGQQVPPAYGQAPNAFGQAPNGFGQAPPAFGPAVVPQPIITPAPQGGQQQ